MATFNKLEEIESWKLSREFCKGIWKLCQQSSFALDVALKKQILRSSGSVMDNIAEGFGREGNKEFIQFLSYANGSMEEVKSQLYRAFDRKHLSPEQFEEYYESSCRISVKINNLITYLRKSPYRGQKFRK